MSAQLLLFQAPPRSRDQEDPEDPKGSQGPVENGSTRDFYRAASELPREFEATAPQAGEDGDPYWAELVEQGGWTGGDRGLSLLVELVQNGTVDPWDVDLEVVVDRYMEAVDALTTRDLPTSGRLLFFASVLIRLKAQYLAGRGQDLLFVPEEDYQEDWEDDGQDLELDYQDISDDELESLGLSRRGAGEILILPRQRIQKRRPITIQDLLDALESSEQHERKKEEARERQRGARARMPFQSVKEAMDTLHQDDLVRDIEHAHRLVSMAFQACERIPFENLKSELDEVSAFLAVLFLAARGDVDLDQENFYGAIELIRPPPDRKVIQIVPRERFKPVRGKKRKKKAATPPEEAAPSAEEGSQQDADSSSEARGPLRISAAPEDGESARQEESP